MDKGKKSVGGSELASTQTPVTQVASSGSRTGSAEAPARNEVESPAGQKQALPLTEEQPKSALSTTPVPAPAKQANPAKSVAKKVEPPSEPTKLLRRRTRQKLLRGLLRL